MGIYYGIQYLRENRTKIHVGPLSIESMVMDLSNSKEDGGFRIEINEKLSQEQRIKALIKEIVLFGDLYKKYAPKSKPFTTKDEKIEKNIGSVIEEIYACQPRLRSWLGDKVRTKQNT